MATIDIQQILKDVWHDMGPSATLFIAGGLVLSPTMLTGIFYLRKLGFIPIFLLGLFTGIAMQAVVFIFQVHRSKHRRNKAGSLAATSFLGIEEVTKIMCGESIPPWTSWPEYEKVNWMNQNLKELWPYLNKASCEMIKEQLTPIFEQYKMGPIQRIYVKSLTLGATGPRISGVRTLKGGPDDCIFEMEFDWRQGRDQRMTLQIVTAGPDLKVKVDNVQLFGVIKLVFTPLMDELPGFGAILFSLREDPFIDFDINLLGSEFSALPGLDRMIDNIIKTSIRDILVWPNRIVVPIVAGDFSYLNLKPQGYLDVVLIEAKDFPKTDIIGKTDPFFFLFVRQKAGVIKRSSTKNDNMTPTWNEGFFIEVDDPESQHLTLRLMDDEKLEKAEFIGAAQVEISKVTSGKPVDLWLDLVENLNSPNEGKPKGSVHLNIVWHPYLTPDDEESSPAKTAEQKQKAKEERQARELEAQRKADDKREHTEGQSRQKRPAQGANSKGGSSGHDPFSAVIKFVKKVFGGGKGSEQPDSGSTVPASKED